MTGAQSGPPSLDGFTFVSWLGGGGFADVFLYQQHLPDRQVAVKVMRETVDDEEARHNFNAEANLMAKVSTHPNIVTIYGASVSNDRRPYLLMEYYPLPHYGERLQQGQMAVHEVLDVGIKISSAIETAHVNHIIHRDIKPANILTSDFGEPGLTDFGISAIRTDQSTDESMGYSPPYAPPEILADVSPGNERSDVYSLAATLWALLAGYSPFELADRKLSRSEIISRGLNLAVPPLPRIDVPSSLELALQQALSKDANRRPTSALSFARTLQSIEQELGYRPTPLNLVRDPVITGPKVDGSDLKGDKTQIGRGRVVNPDASTSARSATTPSDLDDGLIRAVPDAGSRLVAPSAPRLERLPVPAHDEEAGTIRVTRPAAPPAQPVAPNAPNSSPNERRLPKWAWVGVAIVLAGILVAVGVVALGGLGSSTRPTEGTVADEGPGSLVTGVVVEAVSGLTAVRDGTTIHFTWKASTNPDVTYRVTRVDADAGSLAPEVVSVASFDVTNVDAAAAPCVSVFAFISGRSDSPLPAPIVCARR